MAIQDGCGNFVKYSFAFVNLLIWAFACALLGIGIYALVGNDMGKISELIGTDLLKGTAIIMIVAGTMIFLISFLGCCGAFKESKCLLGTFFCFVFILFILTAAGTVVGFVVGSGTILDDLSTELKKSITKYNQGDKETVEAFDYMQQQFTCCGADGPGDWTRKPDSCFTDNTRTKPVFTEGCVTELKTFIEDNSKLFGGITIGVLIFLLMSMIFSCVIMKSID